MPRGKKFTAEQIIGKLREAEVGLAQGKTVPEVVRKLGVTEQTYYRWKRSRTCSVCGICSAITLRYGFHMSLQTKRMPVRTSSVSASKNFRRLCSVRSCDTQSSRLQPVIW
jgi:hypothetical protein